MCTSMSVHTCAWVHKDVQVHLCVSTGGNQWTTRSLIPQATPTLLFEIGSFIGLELAKYVVSIA